MKIIPLYDPPYLIKGTRNNLLNKNLEFSIDGQRMQARWKNIMDVYILDSNIQDFKLLPRLTDEHIYQQKSEK